MRDTGFVDLRSDTVTQPTPQMRRAMADAEVGDDGYGEDPTVNRLEERFAALLGKQDALFVPSGTMANQIAMCLLSRPGTNVVVGWRSHVVNHEEGASARNALIQFVTVDDANGALALDDVQWAIEAAKHHHVEVSAISVENTHMVSGGTPVSLELLRGIAALRLPVHMDGARLFNASVATGIAPAIYAATATTVMVSLSKGLAAPVGSLLVMPTGLADRARVERKRLGARCDKRASSRLLVWSPSTRWSSGSPTIMSAPRVCGQWFKSAGPGASVTPKAAAPTSCASSTVIPACCCIICSKTACSPALWRPAPCDW